MNACIKKIKDSLYNGRTIKIIHVKSTRWQLRSDWPV